MRKVLFINHTNNLFGAETVLSQVLERCENKENVYIAEPSYTKDSAFRKKMQALGCNKITALCYKNLGVNLIRSLIVLIYNIPSVISLCKYVKRNEIDYIYSNTSVTCIGAVAAALTNKKHIWHIHETTDPEHGYRNGINPIYRLLFSYNRNEFIFITEKQRKQWQHHFNAIREDNSQIIYNCIKQDNKTINKTENQDKNITVFGYLGSQDKRKNLVSLIKAFKEVYDANDRIRLILSKNIGDTSEIIKAYIEENKLSNAIKEIEVGKTDDLFSKIDVLILPSYSETWGMVVTEAMSAGIPTIATKESGLVEVFEDRKETIFIDPYDMNTIASAINEMTNEETRKGIAEAATRKLNEFDFNNKFTQQIRELFK